MFAIWSVSKYLLNAFYIFVHILSTSVLNSGYKISNTKNNWRPKSCMRMHMHAHKVKVCKSEENSVELLVSVYLYMGSRNLTQIARLTWQASLPTEPFTKAGFVQFKTVYLCVALNNWHIALQQCSSAEMSTKSYISTKLLHNFSLSNNPSSQSI